MPLRQLPRNGTDQTRVLGLIDVRRPDRTDDPQFELTGRLCDELGWRYTLFTGLASPVAEALDWLAGYRMDRHMPIPDVRVSLLDSFNPETSLRSGVHTASRSTGIARDVLLGNVLHLLFHCELHVDLSCPLTAESTIRHDKDAAA